MAFKPPAHLVLAQVRGGSTLLEILLWVLCRDVSIGAPGDQSAVESAVDAVI